LYKARSTITFVQQTYYDKLASASLRQTNFEKGEGGVKKCFLGLRQTALLSAEGKNVRHLIVGQLCSTEFVSKFVSKM
jgi:hypothetical protein